MKLALVLLLAAQSSWAQNVAGPAARPFGAAPAGVMASVAPAFQKATGLSITNLPEDAAASLYKGIQAQGVSPEALAKMPEAQAKAALEQSLTRTRVAVVSYAESLMRVAADPKAAPQAREAAAAALENANNTYGALLTDEGRARLAQLAADVRDEPTMDKARRVADALSVSKELETVSALDAALGASVDYELGWSRVSELRQIARTTSSPAIRLAAIEALANEARRPSNPTYAFHVLSMLTNAAEAAPEASAKEIALSAFALERTAMLGKAYAAQVRDAEVRVLQSMEAPAKKGPPPGPPSLVQREGVMSKRAKTGMMVFMGIVIAHWSEHLMQTWQVWVMHWPRATAGGLLGLFWPWLVHWEVLHYSYALAMLIGLWKLRGMFRGNAATWWKIALGIQVWHHFEHFLLISQVMMGIFPPTSILQLIVPRIELHMFYNTIVTIPMLVALWQERALLKLKVPKKLPQIVGALAMLGAASFLIWMALQNPAVKQAIEVWCGTPPAGWKPPVPR